MARTGLRLTFSLRSRWRLDWSWVLSSAFVRALVGVRWQGWHTRPDLEFLLGEI